MTCDAVRAAMLAGAEAEWPSRVLAHLAECDDCAAIAVERLLRRAPVIAIAPTFATDVARRARQDTPADVPRLSAVMVGIGAAGALGAVSLGWFGVSDPSTAVPAAALLLACGEAIVLAAWTLDTDITRARWRR